MKDYKVKSEHATTKYSLCLLLFFILLVILLLLRNLRTLFFWFMYTYSFLEVEKYIFVVKVTSKVIQFLFKNIIISIEFYFKLLSNYSELYEVI